jgi:hypothetical protein
MVRPSSVIDVGCATGTWLRAWQEQGVEEVIGVDGDFLDRSLLEISPSRFRAVDLSSELRLEEEFDLVMCLEVAEHLPPTRAPSLVRDLTRLGTTVAFSAAVPFQGGEGHINEQWPDYWASLFREHDYEVVDCVRARLWDEPEIPWWYAQNLLLFVHSKSGSGQQLPSSPGPLSIVHPHLHLNMSRLAFGRRRGAVEMLEAAQSSMRRHLRSLLGRPPRGGGQ